MNSSYPLVCIIIVNWNLKDVTIECIDSLSQLQYPNYKIVVVDNHSQDGSPQAISERFPDIEQIIHKENKGSTAGYNAGFERALEIGADFAFIINNDTIIAPDALDHLVEACLPDDVGCVAPLIYYADAPETIWSAGATRSKFTLDLHGNHSRNQTFETITDRDFLTSCALLIKRDVLEKVGLMDENFFVYQEELDYCYRVTKARYRLLLVPQAKLWHKVSISSGGSGSPNESYWMAKNGWIYYKKHAHWWQWPFVLFWRTGSAIKTTIKLTRHRNWKALKAYWQGLRDGIAYRASFDKKGSH